MLIEAAPTLAAVLAMSALQSIAEITQETPLELSRRDGANVWQADEYSGQFSSSGTTIEVFEVRSVDRARSGFTVSGPGIEGEISAACAGRQARIHLDWVTFEQDRLSYACDYVQDAETLNAGLYLVLQRRGLFGLARNERAGEFSWNGESYRFETRRLSGPALPTGRVPGYVISHRGVEIAGMDYGVMRPKLYLPAVGSPHREAALVASLSLAFFMDPANTAD